MVIVRLVILGQGFIAGGTGSGASGNVDTVFRVYADLTLGPAGLCRAMTGSLNYGFLGFITSATFSDDLSVYGTGNVYTQAIYLSAVIKIVAESGCALLVTGGAILRLGTGSRNPSMIARLYLFTLGFTATV